MTKTSERKEAARRFAPAGVVFAALGIALFVYFVRRAGVAEIADGMRRLGAGFILVLLASGVRPVVRSLAWTLCVEPPHRLRLRDAFVAFMTGDAVGNVVPFGMVIGEPAKAMLVRERGVPLVAGLSALAVEYIFYSLSVAALIFVGALALLFSYPLPKALRWTSIGALAGGAGIVLAALFVIRLQCRFMSRAIEGMHRRGIARRALTEGRRGRVRAIEDSIYGFYARNRSRFLPILLLESCFH
ncbi:MAG TPA: lysylphosphatidylglycerol synthase transmembrane domain-containing protein, partial [Pyrinomonadaceae bacterium]|nr:lysylphosphatidylglycerol synthase transmembrane domain-containing protein [Pyrinomonadaceae bacterium]